MSRVIYEWVTSGRMNESCDITHVWNHLCDSYMNDLSHMNDTYHLCDSVIHKWYHTCDSVIHKCITCVIVSFISDITHAPMRFIYEQYITPHHKLLGDGFSTPILGDGLSTPITPLILICIISSELVLFLISTRTAPGPISQVLPGCRVRHPWYSKKLFVQYEWHISLLW